MGARHSTAAYLARALTKDVEQVETLEAKIRELRAKQAVARQQIKDSKRALVMAAAEEAGIIDLDPEDILQSFQEIAETRSNSGHDAPRRTRGGREAPPGCVEVVLHGFTNCKLDVRNRLRTLGLVKNGRRGEWRGFMSNDAASALKAEYGESVTIVGAGSEGSTSVDHEATIHSPLPESSPAVDQRAERESKPNSEENLPHHSLTEPPQAEQAPDNASPSAASDESVDQTSTSVDSAFAPASDERLSTPCDVHSDQKPAERDADLAVHADQAVRSNEGIPGLAAVRQIFGSSAAAPVRKRLLPPPGIARNAVDEFDASEPQAEVLSTPPLIDSA